jgi:UDP-GlcNAc:undecaprenyl-phosphate GlcNAc-1-phosphate transferase
MFSTLAFLNVIGVGGWWTLLGTLSSLVIASVLLGYHRLLGQLPAFTGKRFVGWRDRRREVMEVLGHLERLRSEGPQDFGPARWVRLRTELGILLAGLGVPAFEIWSNRTEVTTYGDPERAWAWLTLPIPGQPAGEIRLALAVRLPDLQAEQLMLIERIVATLARTGETLRGATSTASIRSDG